MQVGRLHFLAARRNLPSSYEADMNLRANEKNSHKQKLLCWGGGEAGGKYIKNHDQFMYIG